MASTTPNYQLPYPALDDSANVPRDMQALAVKLDGMPGLARPALVSSLPASPVDGQECYYLADSANGVIWHLRYRAAAPGTYKWEVVGGSALETYVAAGYSPPTGDVWSDPPDSLNITTPLAGAYVVMMRATGTSTVGAGAFLWYVQALAGATSVGYAPYGTSTPGGLSAAMTFQDRRRVNIPAATVCKLQFWVTGQVCTYSNRVLALQPVAVG